jgi:hypothetical protein
VAAETGDGHVVLYSDDFHADVTLTVHGNFVDNEKMKYARQLAAWMNATMAADRYRRV